MKTYDFCFVLSGFPVKIPSGGENIVFNLASSLAGDGYKVCILVHPQMDLELYMKTGDRNFLAPLGKISSLLGLSHGKNPSPKFIGIAESLLISYYKMVKIRNFHNSKNYDYTILKDVDIIFTKSLDNLGFMINTLIATCWQSILFIKEMKKIYSNAYYLMQTEEDNPKFSGPLSKYAKKAFAEKGLTKIVISKKLLKRFAKEHPRFFNIGIGSTFKLPEREKEFMSVLVPLRNGDDKGAKYALEAFEIIKKKEPEVKLFAYGNYSSPLPDYINFSYTPNAKEHVNLYKKCEIFILPSLIEGFAAPPLEAMACGCAVVVTKIWGTEEIKNDVNGLAVPIRNSKAIATSVLRLLRDQKLRQRLAREGFKTSKEYTYQEMYKSFIKAVGQ